MTIWKRFMIIVHIMIIAGTSSSISIAQDHQPEHSKRNRSIDSTSASPNLVNKTSAEYENKSLESTKSQTLSSFMGGLSLEGQWFLAYDVERENNKTFNEFQLKRGYVTLKKELDKTLTARVTQDISVDHEGDGEGDIEIRLKYGYLRYTFQLLSFFTKPFVEFGLVHRPWLDFEQKINRYRVQGKMFLERNGILRSADYGVTVSSLLGGEMSAKYQKRINDDYPGRYGSMTFGIYNGGGYDAIERNENKLLEGRLTIRPLPDHIPGLQASWIGAIGKGNSTASPDFSFNAGFLSWENQQLILTGMVYQGIGNLDGTAVDESGAAIDQNGYSFFGELKLFDTSWHIFGRLDSFDNELNRDNWLHREYIAGISYYILERSKIVIDYDYSERNNPESDPVSIFEIALEFLY